MKSGIRHLGVAGFPHDGKSVSHRRKRIFKRKQLAIGMDLVVAAARKLSVLLHKLWVSGEVYQPLRRHNTALGRVSVVGVTLELP